MGSSFPRRTANLQFLLDPQGAVAICKRIASPLLFCVISDFRFQISLYVSKDLHGYPTPPYPRTHPRTPPGGRIEQLEQKWPLYSPSLSSESSDTSSIATIELKARDEVPYYYRECFDYYSK
jgi:hypothetical protein